MRYWTDEEIQRRADSFFASVVAVEKAMPAPERKDELSKSAIALLVKAGLEPGTFLLEMYRALGLNGTSGKAAQEGLVAKGFMRVHRLVRKGRGAQPQVLEVTKEGAAFLNERGIAVAPLVLKGGMKHSCYGLYVGRWGRARSMRHDFERTLGSKTFDVVLEDQDGRLIGVEICLTGAASMTAQQLLKAAGVAGVEEVLALFETQTMLRSVEQAFSSVDQLGLYEKKVRFCLLAEFME